MQTSSTDLPLTVARVDQLSRVAKSKRVEADPDPGGDESHKEEKAGHVCAAPLRVGTLVRGIVDVRLIFVLIPAATTFSHYNLKQRLKLCCVNSAPLVVTGYCSGTKGIVGRWIKNPLLADWMAAASLHAQETGWVWSCLLLLRLGYFRPVSVLLRIFRNIFTFVSTDRLINSFTACTCF